MANLIYNPTQCYMSFPFFRHYAKRWFNKGFFLHDVGYHKQTRWKIHKKVVADWELFLWIIKRSKMLHSTGEFSPAQLALGCLFGLAAFVALSFGGFIGWLRVKRYF